MEVHVELTMIGRGNRFLQAGSFPVTVSDFKRNPDETVAIIAYEWIETIKRDHGYNMAEFALEKVIYNAQHDITKIVKQLRPVIEDNLPF
ncbi:hypothetical protein [Peribacillus sp. SCS-155]|uniref:hypothetical protein n=1 Tax=Peribacillus sedimenti TaxID=3115297 RepID=UPI003905F7A7